MFFSNSLSVIASSLNPLHLHYPSFHQCCHSFSPFIVSVSYNPLLSSAYSVHPMVRFCLPIFLIRDKIFIQRQNPHKIFQFQTFFQKFLIKCLRVKIKHSKEQACIYLRIFIYSRVLDSDVVINLFFIRTQEHYIHLEGDKQTSCFH